MNKGDENGVLLLLITLAIEWPIHEKERRNDGVEVDDHAKR